MIFFDKAGNNIETLDISHFDGAGIGAELEKRGFKKKAPKVKIEGIKIQQPDNEEEDDEDDYEGYESWDDEDIYREDL